MASCRPSRASSPRPAAAAASTTAPARRHGQPGPPPVESAVGSRRSVLGRLQPSAPRRSPPAEPRTWSAPGCSSGSGRPLTAVVPLPVELVTVDAQAPHRRPPSVRPNSAAVPIAVGLSHASTTSFRTSKVVGHHGQEVLRTECQPKWKFGEVADCGPGGVIANCGDGCVWPFTGIRGIINCFGSALFQEA